ncbi:hypothetical protein MJK72_19805 [Klebsiella pneumoniae]|nr:hypothetical protein MJK72_19805 [Klebsiella pneumoniae]
MRGAIVAGELDIYPEYIPAMAPSSSKMKTTRRGRMPPNRAMRRWCASIRRNISWYSSPRRQPTNTWTIARMPGPGGEKYAGPRWPTLSLPSPKQGGEFKLAASAEFIDRPDALPAFEKAYGFNLIQNQLLSLAGGDTAVTIKAAAQQTSGANAAIAYGTDGPVAALGLQTLSDPQGVQPIYAPTPVVRETVLESLPADRRLAAAGLRQPR